MRIIKYIFALIFLFNITACSTDQGPIGPAGDAGKDGAQGFAGDKGPTGDKGATGATGAASQTAGVSNLFVSPWKKAVWKFEGIVNDKRVFEAEVPFAELTNDVINKGFVRAYRRLNGKADASGLEEFSNGVVYTTSNSTVTLVTILRGFKEGKMLIRGEVETAQSNAEAITTLTALPIEFRINILK